MPKRKDTKEKKVYFRPREWAVVCKKAEYVHMKTGAFIREMAVRGEIKHYDMVKLNNLRMSFNRISYELNQIAKVANSTQSIYQKDIKDMQKQMKYFSDVMENYLSELYPDLTITDKIDF